MGRKGYFGSGPAAVYERRAEIVRENRARPRFCAAVRAEGESCGTRLRADNRRRVCEACRLAGRRPAPPERPAFEPKSRPRFGYVFVPGLDAAMKRRGVTRALMGSVLDAKAETVGSWALGKTRCPVERVREMAKHLGVPPGELLWEGK